MHQPWRTFATIINRSLSGETSGLDKPRLSRAQILWGMYYKKNVDYVELLWEYFTYQINNRGHKKQEKMSYTKKTRKFKKPTSPKLTTVPVSPEEPTRKSKRVKRPAKKSTNALTIGVVIKDTLVMSLYKKKEKMTVEKCKGIELLFEVALTEEAYATKIKPSITNEGTGAKPGVPDVTKEESIKSEAESWGRDEDDINNDHDSSGEGSDQKSDNESDQEENEEEVEDDEEEKDDKFVKTPSNYTDDEDETNVESKVEDKAEGDRG
ncbi:hypothetical protein Tco_1572023 [Tanacetum coccineum]